jgi:hypothetical protein
VADNVRAMSAGGIDVAGSVLAGLSTKRVTVSMVASFPRNVGCGRRRESC